MSLSITESRSELLAEARAEFNRAAALKASMTGEKAESVPPDTVLIATDPTLSQAILAADASSVSSGGGASVGGGGAGPASASAGSSGTSTPTISNSTGGATGTSAGTTTASGTQSGQLLNVMA
jgi:hypothetical protein